MLVAEPMVGPGVGSAVEVDAAAVLMTVPAVASGSTSPVMMIVPKASGSVMTDVNVSWPSPHATVWPVTKHVPCELCACRGTRPAGSTSDTSTSEAAEGPSLNTRISYWNVLPACSSAGPIFWSRRSATGAAMVNGTSSKLSTVVVSGVGVETRASLTNAPGVCSGAASTPRTTWTC